MPRAEVAFSSDSMTPPFPHSFWLEPGRILCGEYPRDRDDPENRESLRAILEAGVRVFIDLTEEAELKPYRNIALAAAAELGIDAGELEFHRHPIRDISVPLCREEMEAVLRTIRSARQRGRGVYLHCWGGKGRTGTVAGCLLQDLFRLDGEGALESLTRQWSQCVKSRKYPIPDTEEQRRYIRDWSTGGSSLRSRVRAALLGAAVGDALGVPVEFQGRGMREKDPVTGMREYGTHNQPAGTWSDDTSMIVATMTGLLDADCYSPDAAMKEFAAWLGEARHTAHGVVFDVGNATREAIGRYRGGTAPTECGGTSEWSNGNGSLMRILPVALAFANDPELIEKASVMSSLTHAHERSRMACAFYCLVVSELLHASPIEDATVFAWEAMNARWNFSPEERIRFEEWHPDRLFVRDAADIHGTGHVVDTLEASLWVNARHDSCADAVLHAVNLGDDTDTTGCVAGGLAGLIHGEAGIPVEWRETLVKRAELAELADRFADFCLRQSGQLLSPGFAS